MTDRSPVTREQFSAFVDNNQLKTLQIIYLALAMGVSLFLFVIYFLSTQGGDLPAAEQSSVPTMTIVHFIVLISAIFLSKLIYEKMYSNIPANVMSTPQIIWQKMKTAHIVRLAILEAPVFLGLVTCLIGVQDGFIPEEPIYWINLTSLVVFLAFIALSFPNHDRIIQEFRYRFRNN
ncbi:MAG: hypothetical protein ACRBF0_04550 [Calditrichia bacterium]